MTRFGQLACILALLSACNPFSFHDLEDQAPVRSYSADQAEFGQQIAVYTDSVEKETWVAVSSNRVSRYQVYQFFGGGNYIFPEGREGCATCDSRGDFDVGSLGFAAVSMATEGSEFCVATPFNGTTNGQPETGISIDCDIEIPCGVDPTGNPVEVDRCNFKNTVSLSAGAAVTTVFGDARTYAQLLISDPKTGPYLFRLTERTVAPVDFSGMTPGDGFGEEMVAKAQGTGTRLAASQGNQVHVADLGVSGATSLGCLDVGDDVRSLAWINDSVAVGTKDNVSVYPMSSFTTPCSGATLPGITCADLPRDSYSGEVSCAALGEAVGAADVDGDGSQELILGAPLSDLGSFKSAGAVYVVPDEGASVADAVVLVDADPKINQRLGEAVAGVPVYPASGAREEIAAGAPGGRNWRLFLCSGLPGDDADASKQCAQ